VVELAQQSTEHDLIGTVTIVRDVIRYEHVALTEDQFTRRGHRKSAAVQVAGDFILPSQQ
jgi:hypothetical protein